MKVSLASFPTTVYLCLRDDFRAKIFEEARKRVGAWANLARYLGIRDSNLAGYRSGKFSFSLKVCRKLSKLLRLGLSDFEREISWVGSHSRIGIKNPKLPFDFNTPAGARFLLAILCDGKFSQDLRPTYYNFDPTLRSGVIFAAREIFGDVHVFELPDYGMARFPKVVGYALLRANITPGNKTCVDPTIPSFIKNGNQSIREMAIGQIISDEGSVDTRYKKLRIHFCKDVTNASGLSKIEYGRNWATYAPNLLKDSIALFKKSEINTSLPHVDRIRVTKKGRVKIDWFLNISGHKNFLRLASIPVTHPKKKAAIKEYPSTLTRVGKNESLNKALAALWKVKWRVPHFTARELSAEINVSRGYCKHLLKKLRTLGHVEVIEKGTSTTPWRYSLTYQGKAVAKSQSRFF